ncbi:hypothetical protein HNR46_004309, partial [Haloferula luteola]|nr:hypothetical protein [Haloferula luteola]
MIHPVSTDIHIRPDSSRVMVRSFVPGDRSSILRIIERAMALTAQEVDERLALLSHQFGERHKDIARAWRRHYDHVRHHVPHEQSLTSAMRHYIGALFSGEYAFESAALFNPSIVPHPDQSGLQLGELRFVMSLRATGEGHISSIEFRTGVIGADHSITIGEASRHVTAPLLQTNPTFRRSIFFGKLRELEIENPWAEALMQSLGDDFT